MYISLSVTLEDKNDNIKTQSRLPIYYDILINIWYIYI